MFLFNVLDLMFQLDSIKYLYAAFAFFGANLLVRKLILNRGV